MARLFFGFFFFLIVCIHFFFGKILWYNSPTVPQLDNKNPKLFSKITKVHSILRSGNQITPLHMCI